MRQALAMIETRGLLAAIEASDVMLKAADVHLHSRTFVRGGLVCILMEGDVAACKASVDAARSAVERLGVNLLVSSHVIPRPDSGLAVILDEELSAPPEDPRDPEDPQDPEGPDSPDEPEETAAEEAPEAPADAKDEALAEPQVPEGPLEAKADVDASVHDHGLAATALALESMRVVELRNLARTYEDFPITGREISRANKGHLLEYFNAYYATA